MESDIFKLQEQGILTIAHILNNEAAILCLSSPIPNEVKRPTASRSRLTELAKMGMGAAHCAV